MTQNKPENAANENAETTIDMPERTGCVRALLITVIVLGILLVGGLAVVVGTIIKRVTDDSPRPRPETINGKISISEPGFESIINVPEGAALMATEINDRKIILHLRDAEGDFLLLVNMKTGQEIGRVRLKTQKN